MRSRSPASLRRFVVFVFFLCLVFWLATGSVGAQSLVEVRIECFPADYSLTVDGASAAPVSVAAPWRTYRLPAGRRTLAFSAPSCDTVEEQIVFSAPTSLERNLPRSASLLRPAARAGSGCMPKSVVFSPFPDSRGRLVAVSAAFGDPRISLCVYFFDPATGEVERRDVAAPARYVVDAGFVELVFIRRLRELWVTQLLTGLVHVFDAETFAYEQTFPTNGEWPKVLVADREERFVYAANWNSNNVSVIDVDAHRAVALIPVSATPRGMAVSGDGRFLYVCSYGTGNIDKVDLATRRVVRILRLGPGAKRHMVADYARGVLYASDMANGDITAISMADDTILGRSGRIGDNLNSIELSADGLRLFVSERGVNNPESYTRPGPIFGRVFVVDTATLRVQDWAYGRNQPTGIDVSPDDRWLAFTDFLSNTVEFYDVSAYLPVPVAVVTPEPEPEPLSEPEPVETASLVPVEPVIVTGQPSYSTPSAAPLYPASAHLRTALPPWLLRTRGEE